MKLFLAILTFLMMSPAFAETIKVAVIDTGYDFESQWTGVEKEKTFDGYPLRKPKICEKQHKDFTGTGVQDDHGHGTHISGIIGTYAENSDYCLVIIKYFKEKSDNLSRTIKAFEYAVSIGVDVINYSGGGEEFSIDEYNVIQKALNRGIVVITAAGNEEKVINYVTHNVKKKKFGFNVSYINNITLDFHYGLRKGYYPANYDKRIFSVINLLRDGKKIHSTSNRGAAFTHRAVGTNVKSILPDNKVGYLTGTSQAAPKITAKIIKGLQNTKKEIP